MARITEKQKQINALEHFYYCALSEMVVEVLKMMGRDVDSPYYEIPPFGKGANYYPSDVFVMWRWQWIDKDCNTLKNHYLESLTMDELRKLKGICMTVWQGDAVYRCERLFKNLMTDAFSERCPAPKA